MMIDRLFLSHPRQVNESYTEHWGATRFGLLLLAAGLASLIHGLVPACFTRTGSTIIKKLYGEMKQRQPALADQPPAYTSDQWQPEYEI